MNEVRTPQPSIALIVSISIILVASLIHLSESQLIVNDNNSDQVLKNYYVHEPYVRPVFSDIVGGDRHIYCYVFNSSLLEQLYAVAIFPFDQWPAFQLQFYAETEQLQGNEATETNDPLLVTASWHGAIRSWEIPVHFLNDTEDWRRNSRYSEDIVGKVLWHYPHNKVRASWNLTVEINVYNYALIYYRMKIVILQDFVVKTNVMATGIATPSSPAVFMFIPPPDLEYVFIDAASDSNICSRVGVQELYGPFLDQIHMIFSETFTLKTGLTLRGSKFSRGFLLVFNPLLDDKQCQAEAMSQNSPYRNKDLRLVIRQAMSLSDYYLPLVIPAALILSFSLLAFLFLRESGKLRRDMQTGKSGFPPIDRKHSLFNSNIKISDLIIGEPNRVVVQSQRYFRAVFITTAFYSIPVFQLMRTFSDRLSETGNFDLCFFNHYCSHMLGPWNDFNHMYSNIGYLLFGITFAAIVGYRQITDNRFYTDQQDLERDRLGCGFWNLLPHVTVNPENGAINHYSLLYCMAFTLTMTGAMSAGYHVCPNQSNFQFDTVFMYTIAAFTIVTIFQFRHPTYISANFTFTALALVACTTVLGLLWKQFLVRVFFTVIHSLFLISVLPKLCFTGHIWRNGKLVYHWSDMMPIIFMKLKDDLQRGRVFRLQREDWIAPHDQEIMIIQGPGRIVLPSFFLFINALSLLAIWTVFAGQNFATQVLFICVMNGSWYTIFYCILKWCHGECRRRVWIQPGFYLFTSLTLWGVAIYFFFQEVATWETSPAESRLQNKDCILFGFYDSHDMWHFLSSAGLFCSAMLLLTVDDDLVDQPKSTIPVF